MPGENEKNKSLPFHEELYSQPESTDTTTSGKGNGGGVCWGVVVGSST
jgi:hypothetical protein